MLRHLPRTFATPATGFSHAAACLVATTLLFSSVAANEMPGQAIASPQAQVTEAGAEPATMNAAERPGGNAGSERREAPEVGDVLAGLPAPPPVDVTLGLAVVAGAADEPALPAIAALGTTTLPWPATDFVEALPPALITPQPSTIRLPRAIVGGVAEADIAALKAAIAEYRKGKLVEGDEKARLIKAEPARLAAEWAAVRLARQARGFSRLARFAQDNPDLPMNDWVANRAADSLFVEKVGVERVLAFFGANEPKAAAGKIALARALSASGQRPKAEELVRQTFRDDKTNASIRTAIETEFPALIKSEDQRYLALRLVYEGQMNEGLLVARKAGAQTLQLAQLLMASVNETNVAAGLLSKLDLALRTDPAALFARAQNFRRTGKFVEAAQTLFAAPEDAERIVDGDEWWTERRMLVRKLLDSDNAALAYRVAAGHHAETPGLIVDAEVHAGWIALRFLSEPPLAMRHFAKARAAATTPVSQARADYWQGRAAEAMDDPFASEFHAAAGRQSHSFYGQLSLAKLGLSALPERNLPIDDDGLKAATANRGLRVIRALLDADARDLAQPMIIDAAKNIPEPAVLVTLGDLLAQYQLPKLTLQAGKIALMNGMMSEEHAFPTFGIPHFEPTGPSAEKAIVYSIARQESEFDAGVISHAGARGLMQLMPATAMRTANRRNMRIDVARLTTDPVLNAQIGAAHLADLFGDYNGSYILSFAAYNAGGKRVREWLNAYGDPRDPAVDKVDWIERIPITETREYVKKILENLQVYRARLYGQRRLDLEADLQRGARVQREISAAQPTEQESARP